MCEEFDQGPKLLTAFQRGMRELWARSVWRWLERIAPTLTNTDLADYLQINPGNVSRGQKGSLSIDTFLMMLVAFDQDYTDMDPRPGNLPLAAAGYISGMQCYDRSVRPISVAELCLLIALIQNPLWIPAYEFWSDPQSEQDAAGLDRLNTATRNVIDRALILLAQLDELRQDHYITFEWPTLPPLEAVTADVLNEIRRLWYLAFIACLHAVGCSSPNWPPGEMS